MSKNKNTTSEQAVETVEKILDHCIGTLEFWNLIHMWPTNLVYNSLLEARKTLKFIVSDSHIIDK